MCFTPKTPPPRDIGQETRDTLQSQVDLAPKVFENEKQFSPQYTDLYISNANRALKGVLPTLDNLNATAQNRQRLADIAAVEQLGGRASEAFRNANPQLTGMVDGVAANIGTESDLQKELNTQALNDLRLGANLDPSLARQAAQSVRSAQASRGMGFGQADALNEAIFTTQQAEQLRQARRAFAQSVEGQRLGGEGQRFGQRVGAAQLMASTSSDPMMAVLGRPSQTLGMGANFAGAAGQNGPRLFNPESAYGSDVYNTNYNAKAAAQIAGANNTAAVTAGGLSAL